jgi:hypothetical protein
LTTLTIGAGKTVRLSDTTLTDVILRAHGRINTARRLPRLDVAGCKISDLALVFMVVTREHYIKFVGMFRRCRGILVVDDPDRTLGAFARQEARVSRYVGWQKTSTLLLISAEVYDRLNETVIATLEGRAPQSLPLKSWSPAAAAAILTEALGKYAIIHDTARRFE